jgi:uncharacterized membrane protein YeaQ/YmgE (transglycosylase-associated protein family)
MYILWWLIVGVIAGWLTGKIMRGAGYGILMDIIIGIAGAIIGGYLMRAFGFAGEGGLIYTIFVVLLTWIVRMISGSR